MRLVNTGLIGAQKQLFWSPSFTVRLWSSSSYSVSRSGCSSSFFACPIWRVLHVRCSATTIQRFTSASRTASSAVLHAAWPDGFLARCRGKEVLTGEETGRSGGEGRDSSERQKNLSFDATDGATAQELLCLRETLLWPSKGSRHDKPKQSSGKLRTPSDSTEHERTN